MGKGSSRTLAIEWTFGAAGQPDLNNPLMVIRAWLRFYDSGELSVAATRKAWRRCYANLQQTISVTPLLLERCYECYVRHYFAPGSAPHMPG